MTYFFGLLGLGFVLLALGANLLFRYETLNAEPCAMPAPPGGPAQCLRRFAECFYGYVLCVGLTLWGALAGRKSFPPVPGGNTGLPPLVLVHGLYNNAAVWLFLSRILRRKGFPVSACRYGSFSMSLEEATAALETHVRAVEKTCPGQKIIFIGHSLGGVLVRAWLLDPANRQRAKALLTLGTPHGGSKLATVAPGSMARHITPTARLMERLRNAPEPGIPCVALASPVDEAVLPPSALLPPLPPHGSWKLAVTPPVPHFNMLFSRRVADMLLNELETRTAG